MPRSTVDLPVQVPSLRRALIAAKVVLAWTPSHYKAKENFAEFRSIRPIWTPPPAWVAPYTYYVVSRQVHVTIS